MNELDDLDQLERECGPALRVALRRVAAEISVDTSAWQPGPTVRFLNGEQAALDEREPHTTSADDLPRARYRRHRWLLVAAVTIVVLAIGLLAVAAVEDSDTVQTDTVPRTSAPSTSAATTSPTSAPSTSAATTSPTSTPSTSAATIVLTPPVDTTPTTNSITAPDSSAAISLPIRLGTDEAYVSFPTSDLPRSIAPERAQLVRDAVSRVELHGSGHDILAAWNAEGTILTSRSVDEPLVGCAENAMTASLGLVELADDAITSFIAEGKVLTELSAGQVFSRMTQGHPAVFELMTNEHQYFLLRCGGVLDEQARALADL